MGILQAASCRPPPVTVYLVDRQLHLSIIRRRALSGGAPCGHGHEKVAQAHGRRSPVSPCPRLTFVLAFFRRSAARAFQTSSDSLKRPFAPRLTYRLSVLVL